MSKQTTQLVRATYASALVFGESAADTYALTVPESGERTLHLPRLRAHQASGFSYNLAGPNCVLRWARIPSGHSGAVDVVVHLHGYKGHNQMRLAAKAAASGLDLASPGVARPSIGLVPHGHAFASRTAGLDGFDFPAISTKAELDALIAEALTVWASDTGAGRVSVGRIILTGHSGGGAGLTTLMRSLGHQGGVHGFHYFDATYGGQATLTASGGWLDSALQRDLAALAALSDEAARLRYMQSEGSHLRICFIDHTGTAAVARATDQFIVRRLQALSQDAALRDWLRRYYRAQKVSQPGQINHGTVPNAYGGRLLADPANDLSPQAQNLVAPAARAHGADDEDWLESQAAAWQAEEELPYEADDEAHAAAAWDAEGLDTITVPVLVTPERAANAPSGSAFIASLGSTQGVERENRIFEQLRAGNIPPSLLSFATVRTRANDRGGQARSIEYYVTPDVLAIGSESDAVRIPMDPVTAQRVADRFDCLLPTARMVEQIYQAAASKLTFIYGGYAGTPRAHLQTASSSYLEHSRAIDAQLRRPPTVLTAGHKKELVISSGYRHPRCVPNRAGSSGGSGQACTVKLGGNAVPGTLNPRAPMLAFYGAHKANGSPHQVGRNGPGWPSYAHEPSFVDYSHGLRLVWPSMKVDGVERQVADVLADPNLCVLLAAEGQISNPRYTLDRAGRDLASRAQAAQAFDDPLALAYGSPLGSTALGYGQSWDERVRTTVEGFLAGFMAIPVRVGTQTVAVHPPYFMNANAQSAAATRERHRLASEHRAAAPAALRALIGEARFAHARIGKATPEMLRDLLQAADAAGLLLADPRVNNSPTPDTLRAFLKHYGLGVDCSGFVAQALNRLVALFPNAAAADRIAAPHSTASGSLKGGQGRFTRVSDPTQLCGGDTMWLQGHIRILSWAERRGGNIVFCTAESRSSNPRDIGPAIAYWRLVPDPRGGAANFTGWRLERSFDLNAADSGWTRPLKSDGQPVTHVFGHYQPLRTLLQGAGANPVALEGPPPLPSASRQAPPPPPPASGGGSPSVGGGGPATGGGGASTSPPPRTAITRDLTQAEVDRLAAIRFRNAADIETFFRRSGQASFIDWYNAGLAHSTPFAARGAISTRRVVRDRFTGFWNQIAIAFDRAEISALDFAAFTAISINETSGNLASHPESSGRGGGGRSDSRGRHPGLAYFFDRIEMSPGRFKASYNRLSGGRTAGSLFNDADFIAAHGSLGGATRLANHGDDFGGAWNGSFYPQSDFTSDEDAAVNGFIMQADFYKFRGRGVIQTTSRPAYKRAVDFIKAYSGSNSVLSDFRTRWASYSSDVAATRSRNEDWDRIFEQPEMLAKGLSLHAGTRADYRRMSHTASVLLHVPTPTRESPNPSGELGSIYRMGRRISGSGAYGRGRYRERVLALLHGFLSF